MVSAIFLEYLEQLVLTVGLDNVQKLCQEFAGEALYIQEYKENCEDTRYVEFFNKLSKHIGTANAKNICKTFAGDRVFFPKAYLYSQRNQLIKEDYYSGLHYEELSKKYGLTTRRIRDILETKQQKIPTEFKDPQLYLF